MLRNDFPFGASATACLSLDASGDREIHHTHHLDVLEMGTSPKSLQPPQTNARSPNCAQAALVIGTKSAADSTDRHAAKTEENRRCPRGSPRADHLVRQGVPRARWDDSGTRTGSATTAARSCAGWLAARSDPLGGIGGNVFITVVGYQVGGKNSKADSRKLATHTLAEFDLTGEID
jgi:hypothetical protein